MASHRLQKQRNTALSFVMVLMFASLFWMCYRDDDSQFWKINIKTQIKGNQLSYVMMFIAVGLADFLVGECIIRFCIFLDLIGHCGNYNGRSLSFMFKSSFLSHGAKQFLVVPVFMSIISFLSLNEGNYWLILKFMNNTWNYAIILAVSLLPYLLGLKEPTRAELSDYLEKNKLNVGHGLAWSYYFGYLRLILPSLKKRLSAWHKKENEKSKMVHKLYILVPKSCYCYPSLKDADNKISVCQSGPEPVYASRAGSIARTYKTTVYQFISEDDKMLYYCCVEYATPILALYEMSQHEEAGLNAEDRLVQMRQFCSTLNEIIGKNPTFRENCRVLLFDDIDEDGKERKVSTILKEEIDRDIKHSVKNGRI